MVLERNDYLIGIDCGASKVLLQSAKINSSRTIISKGQYCKEYVYSSHPDWDPSYRPIPLDVQIEENNNKSILISKAERRQGDIIVKLLHDIIENISGSQIGICFPGIKDDYGVTILANGPRIPELLTRLSKVDTLYNDSDCCIAGEMVSDIGKMNDIHNGIYIGGGTGIADGILLDLGLSAMQLQSSNRGFTFKKNEKLALIIFGIIFFPILFLIFSSFLSETESLIYVVENLLLEYSTNTFKLIIITSVFLCSNSKTINLISFCQSACDCWSFSLFQDKSIIKFFFF